MQKEYLKFSTNNRKIVLQISKSILYMAKSDEAETLKKLESRIDITKMQKPSFLLVLTAIGKYAYQREDGVYVVPIGCLKN